MTSRSFIPGLLTTLLAVICPAVAAQAQGRVYDFKNVRAPGAMQTDTYAVNRNGIIAGDFVDANNIQQGMIFNVATGHLTTFNLQGCQTTGNTYGSIAAFAINNLETVAGWCVNATTGQPVAFTYAKGKFTNIAFPQAVGTEANGINDKGEVVGTYIDQTGSQHGFYLIGQTYTSLDAPGAFATTAWGVNNAGLITLFGPNANGTFISFTFDGKKTFTEYRVPNAGPLGTVIQDANNNGDLVFTWYDSRNAPHGAWFHSRAYIKFNDPKGPSNTRATGLSDALVSGSFKGQVEIVGRYSPGAEDSRSATPSVGYSAYGCCRGDSQ
jgi:hypothetical protein